MITTYYARAGLALRRALALLFLLCGSVLGSWVMTAWRGAAEAAHAAPAPALALGALVSLSWLGLGLLCIALAPPAPPADRTLAGREWRRGLHAPAR